MVTNAVPKTVKKPGLAKGRRYIGSEIVFNLILLIFALACILPVIHIIAVSMSGREAVMSNRVVFWPLDWDFTAYTSVFLDTTMQRAMIFSVILTVVFTAIAMVVTVLLAYPLSKKRLPFGGVLMVIILIPMYFTGGTIPNYLWVKNLGLLDNPWVLVLPCMTSTYNTIIMRNFFSSIPESLEESARLDGCNDFQILWKIVIPLSTASLATIALFYAVQRWNGFSDVRYYINSSKYFTLQMKLYNLVFAATDTQTNQVEGGRAAVLADTVKCASIVFSTVPILIVYPFLQKYFVGGVMIGAVKE